MNLKIKFLFRILWLSLYFRVDFSKTCILQISVGYPQSPDASVKTQLKALTGKALNEELPETDNFNGTWFRNRAVPANLRTTERTIFKYEI